MATRKKPLTYARSGVRVDMADALVEYIKKRAPGIGGFSGLFPVKVGGERVHLVASTDGVGTKLKLAFILGKHDTVGIDLVAMCVNDLVTCGATPLFFLDYYATGKLELAVSKKIVDGILEGCRQGRMALLGGETAEMPGFYTAGEYDLAGFAVGLVREEDIIDGSTARAGDVICALPSSGVHSNGFSLVRKALGPAELRKRGRELLTPTRIYVDDVEKLRHAVGDGVKALAHITGEGLEGNVPRVLPKGLRAVFETRRWEVPAIFRHIQARGRVPDADMWKTFNMGLGLVAVLDSGTVSRARSACRDLVVVGHIEKGRTPFALREG
ncbi:MAG: phosphoribosylformylglycinamidine cyclo-ligase [Deltaproteobacteria bacterium]|nr:phosphoribosylformylglycinamidine cyclo-ligase [Deltaproteobacteria bacterium]